MTAPPTNNKKRIETVYMEEARRASALFPAGRLEPHEIPDFLLFADGGTIGIEVTELCREEPRPEAGRLSKIPDRARELYTRYPHAEPGRQRRLLARGRRPLQRSHQFNVLTKSLADFVYTNRAAKGTGFKRNLPEGFCHIGVFEPLRDQPAGMPGASSTRSLRRRT